MGKRGLPPATKQLFTSTKNWVVLCFFVMVVCDVCTSCNDVEQQSLKMYK